MTYTFVKSDGGRSTDPKRRHHGKDCMVRALAVATGVPYGQLYDELIEEVVFTPKGGGFMDRLVGQLEFAERDFHGFAFMWRPFPAKAGHARMNPDSFARRYPKGTFILRMGHHLAAMIDGALHDNFAHTDMRCVYGAWEMRKVMR